METYRCYSCGYAIAEDDYFMSGVCPMCDSILGNIPEVRESRRRKHRLNEKRKTKSKKD